MNKQKLVLVGNGMAGIRCIEEILETDPNRFAITVFGREPHVNYNRILLSSVLQGGTTIEDITINNRDWYADHQIQLFTGETVVKIDIENKIIKTDKNRETSYDKLILATGSIPFAIPLPGSDKDGVITFRTIEDCQKMMDASRKYKKAVVIGGGLLGLEAARGLLNLGMDVNVVHLAHCLMERQLDYTASKMLEKELERQGLKFSLEKSTVEIIGNQRVERLRFKDGSELEADLVVFAVGVKPNIKLAKESGIKTKRAIVVNDYLETSVHDVYAVGECVEHRGMVYGLVQPLFEQGKVLAKHICGEEVRGYEGSVLSTKLKISGINVFSAGQFVGDEKSKEITVNDEINGVYKKIVFQGNKIIGTVLYGDTRDSTQLFNMILNKKTISNSEKNRLLRSSPKECENRVASLAQSELICNCHAVTKGAIIEAVQQKGLSTVDQVIKTTKASSACGGCKPLVTELLTYIRSDLFNEVIEQKSMCPCTTLTEDEVVQEMQRRNLLSVKEIMTALNWKQHDGCSACRGALNYYLSIIYPKLGNITAHNMIVPIETYLGGNGCKCDKQPSVELAVQLEKRWESVKTPHVIKVSISSCIHTREDIAKKDIGFIRMNRGWEIHVGCNNKRDSRIGELLYVAETDEEAIEIVISFIQYYRETGNYLEPIGHWIIRLGLIHIREVIFEHGLRSQLIARLDHDVSILNEIAAGKSYSGFVP